jgi:TonB family protein
MKTAHPSAILGLLLVTTNAVPLRAQHTLYVNDGDQAMRLVRKFDRRNPYVMDKGKLALPAPLENTQGGPNRRYKLQLSEEFLPSFVTVKTTKANFAHGRAENGGRLDLQFQFTATFSTNYRLTEVFFVLEFDTDNLARKYFVQEISPVELQQARTISIEVPLASADTREKYELRVFSSGLEVFHSGLPRPIVEEALAKMVAKRIKDVREAAPKPLTGPIPRYPESLPPAKGKGQATVSCVIAANGKPQNVKVKSASDPAFGEAAVAAMSEWWFVPKVADGKPIDSAADLPFEFTPPAAKKS